MHLYQTIQSFLYDQDYFIDLWQQNIHVYGFVDVLTLEEKQICLQLPHFALELLGNDFRVLKLTKNEILIQGTLESLRVLQNG